MPGTFNEIPNVQEKHNKHVFYLNAKREEITLLKIQIPLFI